jgi:N-acetylmuramoyl-L-alanine amidase CwlA
MSYDIKIDLIPGLPQRPYRNGVGAYEGIVIHDTECPGDSDEMEVKYFKQNWQTRQAFVHFFCDFDSITQTAKAEYQAWGAGNGNPRYCHIEMITASTQQAFDEVYKRTCWLAASKLFERKLDVVDGRTLVSHDWVTKNLGGTTHTDPIVYLKKWGKTWADIVKDVKVAYDALAKPITPTPTPVPTPAPVTVGNNYKYNTVYKERIYSSNDKIVRCDGDYKTTATDIRLIKFDKNATKLEFVYQKGAKVSDIVKAKKAFIGTNGPFFANQLILGNCKIGTQVISQAYGKTLKWHSLIYKDGKLSVGIYDINEPCDFMIQCSPPLVENGVNVVDKYVAIDQTAPDIAHSYCQRTFIGIDDNGDIFSFASDGRTNSDRGLSLNECANYAISKNCKTAFAFDGGSSTILADQTGGLNQKLNTGVNERAVNHALLFYVGDKQISGDTIMTPVKIELNTDSTKEMVDGFIVDGKSYVEVRKAGVFFGVHVEWDQDRKIPILKK